MQKPKALSTHSRQIPCYVMLHRKKIGSTSERHYSRRNKTEYNLPVRVIRMVIYLKNSFVPRIKQLKIAVPIIKTFHKLEQIWSIFFLLQSPFLIEVAKNILCNISLRRLHGYLAAWYVC